MKKLLLNSKSFVIILLFALISFSGKTFATTYYSSASAAPETLANWWVNTNGTGAHPANFTTAGDIFIIQTGNVMTQAAAWTVTGSVTINSGGTLARGTNAFTCGGLVINGTMTNGNGSSTTVNGNVSGTGTLSTGTTARIFNVTGDWTFSGASVTSVSVVLNGAGNQALSGVITQTGSVNGDLTINKASGIVTLGSAITIVGSTSSTFTLTAGTFDPAAFLLTATTPTFTAGTLRVGATTWAGNYSFAVTEPAAGIIEYNRAGAQTINNVTYGGFLTLSGGGAKTLAGSTTVTSGLTLTSGVLTVPTGSTLTLTPTGQIAGTFSTTNCINTQVNTGTGAKGIVRVNVPAATARVIPVSDGTNYLPITINATNASGYNITVFDGITTNSAPNGTPFSAAAKSECVDVVWNVNLASGTGTGVNITLGWGGVLEGSKFALIASPANVGIAPSTAGIWANALSNSTTLHSSTTRNGITVAATSSFAVGTIYPGGGPLPIKMAYFNAAKGNGYNTLNWSADATSDAVTFDIERSADGKNFTVINSIYASRQDMLQPFNYVDNSILSGTVYYRIKITDINGKVTYSSVVRIVTAQTDMQLVGVLPNPVSNTAQLNIVSAKKDNVQLYIVSMTGQLVQRSAVQLQPGSSIINLDVTNLQNGMYTIKGTFSDGTVSAVKFVKQ